MEATLSGKKGLKWENPFSKVQWSKPLYTLATLVVYALVLNTLGFILSTAFLVGFLLRTIYPQKWFVVILGATLTPLITYLVFKVWLRTQLPPGVFGS